jgi:two-component system, chemotaxis family, sensor kinase CheA
MASAQHKYLSIFVTEAREQLAQLEGELVRIETEAEGPAGALLWDSIFRKAHSVKGSAATLGLTELVALAHAAEALIFKLKTKAQKPERGQVEMLLQATDAIARLVGQAARQINVDAGDALPRPQLEGPPSVVGEGLVGRLAAAAQALPDPQPAARFRGIEARPAIDPALPRYQVVVQLSSKCQAPGARALIVQRKLKALGTLIDLEPTPAQLMQTKGAARLTADVASARSADELRLACASVPEVDSVTVSSTGNRVVQGGAGPGAAPPPPDLAAVKVDQSPPAPRAQVDGRGLRPEPTVRVKAESLDQLLDAAGEVLLGIARLREASRKLPESHAAAFETEVDRLRRTARELHNKVMGARLTPFSALTERLPRAVRDLSQRLGKEVDLIIEGAEVELDRAVIEAMGDPLSHLVRNAVDHGLESTAERAAKGKQPRGKLTLSARRERNYVVIDLSDDGRGLDGAALARKAIASGALSAEAAALLTPAAAVELAFLPGLSTRAEATDVSGRGVGLDAVQRSVEQLGGRLSLRSEVDCGARFTIELPLSVSMSNLLLVQAGGEVYGLPVARVLVTTEYDLSARGGEGFESRSVIVGGAWVTAYGLATLFGLPSLSPPGPRPFVVLEVDGVTFALAVDRLAGQEEAVIKPLAPPLDRVRGLLGTTVLGNGRPLLVLDPRGLAEMAGVHKGAALRAEHLPSRGAA